MLRTRRLGREEWPLLRDLRLRALREDPRAFASSYAREAGFADADWAARLRSYAWFVAGPAAGAAPIGLLGGRDDGTELFLVAMWVAAGHRGRGVAAKLVDALAGHARERGMRALALQVNEHNTAARRVYERLGFVATGAWQTLPRADAYRREGMRLDIAGRPR